MSELVEASGISGMWQRLGSMARTGFVAGVVLCICFAVYMMWWALHVEYQLLFSNLKESDAAVIVAELKKQKIQYLLDDATGTISVPSGQVYATRLSLMSGGMPLTGGVGFEIFDRQGLGATEQSQRVTYQRALQGELSRTIGAMENVRQARVLLVLAETALFKRDQQKPRAAVSLVLEENTTLSNDQILGIQRLVAASVAGMDVNQVVVADQRGITLSEVDPSSTSGVTVSARLKLKAEIEDYFSKKILTMLEHVLGPGKAIVTTDATLNFDQVSKSIQTLLPISSEENSGATLRKRETYAKANSGDSASASAAPTDSRSTELEFEFGRKVEQVASAPGVLEKLSISLIVSGALSADREQRLQQIVRAAAGIDPRRGDTVAVDAIDRVSIAENNFTKGADALPLSTADRVIKSPAEEPKKNENKPSQQIWLFIVLLLVGTILATLVMLLKQKRLSARDREALLADILSTLDKAPATQEK